MTTLTGARTLLGSFRFLIGCIAALAFVPMVAVAASPTWWGQRGVQIAHPADDFSVANVGQLKNIAAAAYDELNARSPQNVSDDLDTLIKGWFELDQHGNFALDNQGHRIPKTTDQTDDYAAINLGQLKTVAKCFYDSLIAMHYTNAYPWAGQQADDFALANLGQLKNLFSFDITFDGNGDGIPDWWQTYYQSANTLTPTTPFDWWELYYLGQWGIDPNALAPSGDGMTLWQKFQEGVDPDLYQSVPLDQQSPIRLIVYTRLE